MSAALIMVTVITDTILVSSNYVMQLFVVEIQSTAILFIEALSLPGLIYFRVLP